MATTFVQIGNRAITFLGGITISSLEDDTDEGRAIKRVYEQTRDHVLRDHPWNFAIKRVSIAANTVAPIYEYTNAYNVPADWLRTVEVDTEEEWVMEGRAIVSDASAPLKMVYIHQVTDATLFDAKFIEAYATRLAADIAYDITASQTIVRALEEKYFRLLSAARLVDAQESSSEKDATWLESRN
jgi:hypothetical protein